MWAKIAKYSEKGRLFSRPFYKFLLINTISFLTSLFGIFFAHIVNILPEGVEYCILSCWFLSGL
jgi:hypothetical protein